MTPLRWLILAAPLVAVVFVFRVGDEAPVQVASKSFTESVILGDILTQLTRLAGVPAQHRRQLGGTRIVFNALVLGDIDFYVEYTGTLLEEILADQSLPDLASAQRILAGMGVRVSRPLGFNNTYAIGMRRTRAEELALEKVSDLRQHPDLKLAFSNEFMDRGDGWPSLRSRYLLPHRGVRGIEHELAYPALENGSIDVTDLYTTDAKILKYDLTLLDDDLNHFPRYDAIVLYRNDLLESAPEVVESLLRLEGTVDEQQMIRLNARVELEGVAASVVAAEFVQNRIDPTASGTIAESAWNLIVRTSREHFRLVILSLVAAIVVGTGLGLWATLRPQSAQLVLAGVGVIQTIPSLALLVMLMSPLASLREHFPWVDSIGVSGIGEAPAVVALFLYSLLPIVRNTHAGLAGVSTELQESAEALGLPRVARLRLIEIPLALPTILAGIKTAAVINIGFATLGALIGAGGYGQPILTGIRLNDYGLIWLGAGPAAALAIVTQLWFELVERAVVPKGLRLKRE